MSNPFGVCPLCGGVLKIEGLFVVCGRGDYKARAGAFNHRWKLFAERMATIIEPLEGVSLADNLLEDLKKLNQRERAR